MRKLKHAFFLAGLAVIAGSVTIPTYAYYTDCTATAANAISAPTMLRVRFQANGGSGSMEECSLILKSGSSSALPECTFAKRDCAFAGWNSRADGSGESFDDGANAARLAGLGTYITLYAQWEAEDGDLIETKWDRHTDTDADGNGTPDRLELRAGQTYVKDPSLKNPTSAEVYAYLLVSVPTVSARLAGDGSAKVYDLATLNTTAHWTLVKSVAASSAASRSNYLYRYDAKLSAHGAAAANPYDSMRSADRSTDLLTGFTVRSFTDSPALSSSIDVSGLFVEAVVTETEADTIAIENFTAAGL